MSNETKVDTPDVIKQAEEVFCKSPGEFLDNIGKTHGELIAAMVMMVDSGLTTVLKLERHSRIEALAASALLGFSNSIVMKAAGLSKEQVLLVVDLAEELSVKFRESEAAAIKVLNAAPGYVATPGNA